MRRERERGNRAGREGRRRRRGAPFASVLTEKAGVQARTDGTDGEREGPRC